MQTQQVTEDFIATVMINDQLYRGGLDAVRRASPALTFYPEIRQELLHLTSNKYS